MERRFICDGTKYEVGKATTIGMPIEIMNLPEQIEVEGEVLLRRTDFHISLVCMGQILERHALSSDDFMIQVEDLFCGFVQDRSIDFVRFRDEYRFARLGEKASVVVMCEVSGLDNFFDLLNQKFDLRIEYPPTHITLFTKQLNSGIYLTDSSDLRGRTKVITRPAGVDL